MINKSLITLVTQKLSERQATISVAESCTGGLLSSLLSQNSGSSNFFLGGVVSYANSAKEDVLKVKKNSILKFGAVSEIVAQEMAHGVRRLFFTDYSLSITGIAGPTGGTAEKPVGTVWIGYDDVSTNNSKKFFFTGDRDEIRKQSCEASLRLLLELME